jgi:hypothetical protein
VPDDLRIIDCHNHPDICGVIPIHDILGGQEMGSRDADSTKFVKTEKTEPELVAPLQDEHDRITLANADRLKKRSCPVAVFFQLPKGKDRFVTLVVTPDQRNPVRLTPGNLIRHIIGKIEGLRHGNREVFHKVLKRLELRPGKI